MSLYEEETEKLVASVNVGEKQCKTGSSYAACFLNSGSTRQTALAALVFNNGRHARSKSRSESRHKRFHNDRNIPTDITAISNYKSTKFLIKHHDKKMLQNFGFSQEGNHKRYSFRSKGHNSHVQEAEVTFGCNVTIVTNGRTEVKSWRKFRCEFPRKF